MTKKMRNGALRFASADWAASENTAMSSTAVLPAAVGRSNCSGHPDSHTCLASSICHGNGFFFGPCTSRKNAVKSSGVVMLERDSFQCVKRKEESESEVAAGTKEDRPLYRFAELKDH